MDHLDLDKIIYIDKEKEKKILDYHKSINEHRFKDPKPIGFIGDTLLLFSDNYRLNMATMNKNYCAPKIEHIVPWTRIISKIVQQEADNTSVLSARYSKRI